MNPAEVVRKRSEGRCEAMVSLDGETYSRCWDGPVEVHHVLTRARGGRILDEIGETYHLMALCPRCHIAADGEAAYTGGLLIDGYVQREGDQVVYYGTDPYLSERYPQKERT